MRLEQFRRNGVGSGVFMSSSWISSAYIGARFDPTIKAVLSVFQGIFGGGELDSNTAQFYGGIKPYTHKVLGKSGATWAGIGV